MLSTLAPALTTRTPVWPLAYAESGTETLGVAVSPR
jgi:hypothetical protein